MVVVGGGGLFLMSEVPLYGQATQQTVHLCRRQAFLTAPEFPAHIEPYYTPRQKSNPKDGVQ